MKKRVTWVETLEDGPEIEFYSEPIDGTVKQQKCGDRYVVGYLSQDFYPCNPMKEYDGQGTLYTYKQGVITDDNYAACRLGLISFADWHAGPEYDLDLDCVAEELVRRVKVAVEAEFPDWFADLQVEIGTDAWRTLDLIIDKHRGEWTGVEWDEEDDENIAEIFAKIGGLDIVNLEKKIWEECYEAGKIGDKLAIPVKYIDNNHGSGTTTIRIASLDTCNAVWVPDQCCLDNMGASPTYEQAEEYAKSVLSEYEKWCNGEVYGVCVEVFDENGEQVSEDSCWGHIGAEFAEETLDGEFTARCEREVEKYERDVRTQCGKQQAIEFSDFPLNEIACCLPTR